MSMGGITPRPSRAARIIAATAEAHGITPKDILGASRMPRFAHPRQIAMALCREATGASYPSIARLFRRDHTTVLHAERAVAARMTPALAEAMDRIRERAGVSA